jgi:two-component system, NarL family, sensor histidine kinase UhpB
LHPSRDREASHTIAKNRSDRQADEEHGELETRFRTLVEQIPAIVYIWSVKGSLDEVVEEFVSPQIEDVLGFRAEEWMANPRLWIDTLHPDDRDEVISETTRSFEAGEPFKMEYRVLAKDGRVVWLHDVASVVSRDDQGRAARYQGVQLDITARKEAEHAQRQVMEKLQRLDQQRRQLLVRSARTQEEERRRIADDIHDDTMQRLLAIPMWLESAAKHHPEIQTEERFVKLQEVVSDAVARLRHMVFELHPRILDDEGLVAAIRSYLDGWTKLGASSRFEIANELSKEPPQVTRLLFYRIIQEALTNARRHAEASLVLISLRQQAGGFDVVVEDDGIGFDVHAAQGSADGHSGLSSMLERAEVAGGWCRVESRPGRTAVEVWVPEHAPEDAPLEPERWVGPAHTGVVGAEGSVHRVLTARGLSPREIEVARLLALGHTNAEIAASLYLSVRTIEHHRANVFRKLRVHSRAALVHEMRQRPASQEDRPSLDA